MIKAHSVSRDEVIKSCVALAETEYDFALTQLFPLLDRFGEQRKTQNKKFHARLKKDIVAGCIMPPITIAFVDENISNQPSVEIVADFINSRIAEGYILDGMQRLYTLKDASNDEKFNRHGVLYLNVIIAERYDFLLYRMITLNNGQKPMTARHQIEMLTKGAVSLAGLSIQIATEKETDGTKIHGAFKKSDVVEAYTAFLTDSVNNQNSKIIEAKLDEIIVGKVMDSDLSASNISFSDVLHIIDRLCSIAETKEWLRQVNNLIGFTVGAKSSFYYLQNSPIETLASQIKKFEAAFEAINPSKVNVGRFRRELSAYFIARLQEFSDRDVSELESAFFDRTLTE